jgi:predicted DNA-binding transcriptional regulator AlpA
MSSTARPKRLLRPKEAWSRLGCKRTKFYEDYVKTGRLRLVTLGPKSKGAVEDEVDSLIDELIAARDSETA